MYDEICMVGGKSRPIRRSALGGGVEAWAFVDADSSFSGPGLGHPLRHPTVGLDAPMCRRMVKGGGLLASCWIHSNFWNGFGVFVEGWKGIISSHKSAPWGLFDASGQMDQRGVHNGVLSAFQARFASLNARKRNRYS